MSQGVFTFTFFEAVHKILLPWFSIALCRWIPMCVSVFLFCTPPLPPLTAIRLGKQPSPSDVCLLNNWDSHCSVASEWPQRLPITSPLLSGQYPKPAPKHQNLPPPKKKINTSGYLAFCTHFQLKHIEVLENWYLYFYWLVVFFFIGMCASPVSSSKNHFVFWAHLQRLMTSWTTSVSPTFIRGLCLLIPVYSFKTFASCPFWFYLLTLVWVFPKSMKTVRLLGVHN